MSPRISGRKVETVIFDELAELGVILETPEPSYLAPPTRNVPTDRPPRVARFVPRTAKDFKHRDLKRGWVRIGIDSSMFRVLVRKVYRPRIEVAARLFGLLCHPTANHWYVPTEAWKAFEMVVHAFGNFGTEPTNARVRRYALEAAHYAFVHGSAGLDALRATQDLEGRVGLMTLLDTWWRT